jgi:tetratricopeptide (TPR) repeat protein
MSFRSKTLAATAAIACGFAVSAAGADTDFEQALHNIQHEWGAANYSTGPQAERRAAFDELVEHSAQFAEQYATEVEAIAWDGIVLSTYAGVVSKLSAMRYAKAARERLHQAEAMNPAALGGGVYASLGALYSKVPGGFMGFGDDELAEQYFQKAISVDATSLDSNYFYGEFLLEHGRAAEAVTYLTRALESPAVEGRPIFDAGRRAEARTLLESANKAVS